MHASHMLLGGPWQIDRHAIHDGFRNRYSFSMHGWKHILTPLPPEEVLKDQIQINKTLEENIRCADERVENNNVASGKEDNVVREEKNNTA